ncbi:MAG: diguanylate cyclase [Sphingomonadaceae bacterium]
MSLRVKLMLAMLLSGLSAVALVGGIAYVGVISKVDAIRRQQAAEHFYSNMSAYLQRYGSWDAANQAERFDVFVRRNASSAAQTGTGIAPLPADDGPASRPGRPDGAAGQRPPPEDMPGQRLPPEEGTGQPPLPLGEERGETPFRFIVADADFRVLLGAGRYRRGEPVPAAARVKMQAISADGRVLAYVSSDGVQTPNKQERQYLAATREALLVGVAAAAVLSLVLGVALAQGLSLTLSRLTQAVRAMHGGALRQRVPVQGKDEIATLAMAFNDMSEQLARGHEALQQSHQTIQEQAEQLRELSVRDGLTNLYNRRHFDEQASFLFNQALRHQRPLSLAMGDIDFFKRINDQFGHATGDAVLRQVAEILRHHVRRSDLVARYGGEEFVIALPETALPQAVALCEKLRQLIERFPWQQLHADLAVTISMGVSAEVETGSPQAMLRLADAQLYRAKQSGRNRVCCRAD